jgi:hypothetical protein
MFHLRNKSNWKLALLLGKMTRALRAPPCEEEHRPERQSCKVKVDLWY